MIHILILLTTLGFTTTGVAEKKVETKSNLGDVGIKHSDVNKKVKVKINLDAIETKQSLAYSFDLTPRSKFKLDHPEISNHEVSLQHGVYGVKLGSTYLQAITVFGDPSVELKINNADKVLGYGRRHWLHFQSDKLVNIQSQSPLSQDIKNKIPLRDFFDFRLWKINNQLAYRSDLADVGKALNVKTMLNKDNQLVIKQAGSILTLNFNRSKEIASGKTSIKLNGFSMQLDTYQANKLSGLTQELEQYKAIEQAYVKTKENKIIDWMAINGQLGHAIGRVTLSAKDELLIYNRHLLVQKNDDELAKVFYIDKVFVPGLLTQVADQPWQLDKFVAGKTLEQLRADIPANSFELNGEIEISADNYNLALFFDEIGEQKVLSEAQLQFD